MKRRLFIGSALATLAGCRREEDIVPTAGVTVADLATRLREGRVSAERVLDYYLGRIAALDRAGPQLHALMEVNPDVRQSGGAGPLRGIPILIKDNIETADAMETTAGSLALLGAPKPAQDATVVQRLREAGAVILGKTNLSEWANLRSPNSTSGWSARGGLTLNPHNPEHTPSGSSSGSAVAVAAGLCAAAVGTETNGSIVSPAAMCGIVGLKPTLGLVSRAGIIPISRWQDTPGPMTQTVRDAALLLNVLAGKDARDAGTAAAQVAKDYSFTLGADGLKGRRLGVLTSLAGRNRQVGQLFEHTLRRLEAAGAVLVREVEIPLRREASSAAWEALLTEFRQDLNAYLAGRGGRVRSLAEVIAYNEEYRDQEMAHFNQEFFIEAETRRTEEHLAKAKELRALATRLAGPEGMDAVLKEHGVEALICPTNDPAGRVDLELGDANVRSFSTPAAVAGYPHLTVPMGLVEDLPVGLSFIGPAWSEVRLLELGHAFENIREYQPRSLFV